MSSATKNNNISQGFVGALVAWLLLSLSLPVKGMVALTDEEMSNVTGQALIVSNKIQGTGSTETGTSGLTFYSAGLDAELALNLNIKNLELGRTGPGATDVDIWAENVAFGCAADGFGNCVNSNVATELRDFVLTRPFFQFAIENDESVTNRKVVGIRLGAENAEGPLSIGEFKSFSGYLNATANFTMEAQGRLPNGSNDPNSDVAITCGQSTAPCTGNHNHSTGVNAFGLDGFRSLGLNNDQACFVICVAFRDLTVNFGAVQRLNRPVVARGSRLTSAQVFNANLNSAVDEIVSTLGIGRSNASLSAGFIDFIFPIVAPQARRSIKGQLYTALGINATHGTWNDTAAQRAALENHVIPYNISNLHRVEVNSPLFGLSFQSFNGDNGGLRYPGYIESVPTGWGMYLPDAFTLDISAPTAEFVQNIVAGGARQGNIIGLEPVFDNCWGSATFC